MERHPNAATDSFVADGVGEAGETGDHSPPHRLTTDMLVLRRAHPDEVSFDRLHALFADAVDPEEVFALCGWDEHADEAETRAYLDQKVEEWERGESYEYILESRADGGPTTEEGAEPTADGEYVGGAALAVDADDGSGEFGFWLRKPYWGRGLAGEGVDALVHAAFEFLGAPYVVAGCLAPNDRSRRAIEKFVRRYGGAYYGSPPTVPSRYRTDGDAPVVVHHEWVITREQYETGDAGLSTLVPGVAYDDLDF